MFHVAVVRNTNNVVVNSLFYKGLRGFEVVKNKQKKPIFGKLFAICLQTYKNLANKLKKCGKSVKILAFILP